MHKGKILPPVYVLAALVLALGLHYTWPVATIVPSPWNRIGIVVLLAGLTLIVSPAFVFSARRTAIKPFDESTVLIQDGLYAYSRNPIYVGMTTMVLGVALLLGTVKVFVTPILLALVLRLLFIRVEEKMLEDTFGQVYLTYKSRVRRWL